MVVYVNLDHVAMALSCDRHPKPVAWIANPVTTPDSLTPEILLVER